MYKKKLWQPNRNFKKQTLPNLNHNKRNHKKHYINLISIILHQVKPTYTYMHIHTKKKKKTPPTQHKVQKPKFTQFKPQQKKSEKHNINLISIKQL